MSAIDPEKLAAALSAYSGLQKPDDLKVIFDAARAHLSTLPRVKEVEVWRVEFGQLGHPHSATFETLAEAEKYEKAVLSWPHTGCVKIVPHKQQVPA